MNINLDDTGNCPLDNQCRTCDRRDDLYVVTFETPVGVLCVTMCSDCSDDPDLTPALNWIEAVELSGAHAVHLGIDVDEMANQMEAEESAVEV